MAYIGRGGEAAAHTLPSLLCRLSCLADSREESRAGVATCVSSQAGRGWGAWPRPHSPAAAAGEVAEKAPPYGLRALVALLAAIFNFIVFL